MGNGYTLIELLVVLTIMALLTAAVPVLISAARPGVEARTGAYNLASDMRAARASAIAQNQSVMMRFEPKDKAYITGPDHHVYRLSALVALDPSIPEIRFYPDGSSSGVRVTLSAGNRHYRITNYPLTGRVAVDE